MIPDMISGKNMGRPSNLFLKPTGTGSAGILHMMENGLIYAAQEGKALTWMDAIIDDRPVTPRDGCTVEINALWYNAVCQALEWARGKDEDFVGSWAELPERIAGSFNDSFWNQEKAYLADYFNHEYADLSVRPNQILAVSLNYSPLSTERKKSVLDVTEGELLTPRGLRTLSPKNEAYKGVYEGNQVTRDLAYHQGTVWPWLLEHFVKGYLGVYKRSGHQQIKRLYEGFEEALMDGGIGSISEVYDGNPPNNPKGGISQATAVAALLRVGEMIENFNQ